MTEKNKCGIEVPYDHDKFNTIVSRLLVRKDEFYVKPGLIALLFGVLFTAAWVVSWSLYLKNDIYSNDKLTPEEKSLYVVYFFLGYFALIIPVTLGIYIFCIWWWASKDYKNYYPEETWPGFYFWASMFFIIMVGIVVCLIMIQHYRGDPMPTMLIVPLVIMAIVIGFGAGYLATIVISCKLTASDSYKVDFKCETSRADTIHASRLMQAIADQEKLKKTIETSTRDLQALSRGTVSSEEAAKAISRMPIDSPKDKSRYSSNFNSSSSSSTHTPFDSATSAFNGIH